MLYIAKSQILDLQKIDNWTYTFLGSEKRSEMNRHIQVTALQLAFEVKSIDEIIQGKKTELRKRKDLFNF